MYNSVHSLAADKSGTQNVSENDVIKCAETKLPSEGPSVTSPGKLFAGLTAQQLDAAETVGQLQEFAKGQSVFQEGEPGDCMYVVLSGSVDITKNTESGRRQSLSNVGVGDFFGEMSIIDAQPRSAHAIAQEPTILRALRREELDQLLIINPQIIFNLLKSVTERLRSMNTQFIEQIVRKEKLALVGQMARSIIHDIKNPLAVIRAQSEWLGRQESLAGHCGIILRNVDHITIIANDLLDFSRGVVSLNLQPTAPKAWLGQVLDLLKPMIEGRTIALKGEVLTQDLLDIDANRMTRVVYNLAVNAVQAIRGKGILIVRIARDQQDFEISVIDNGPGIPEEIRDRLFDPFVTAGKLGGTGLGTSIAKKIVEEHGGRITFETQTGMGTTFRIRLPGTVRN